MMNKKFVLCFIGLESGYKLVDHRAGRRCNGQRDSSASASTKRYGLGTPLFSIGPSVLGVLLTRWWWPHDAAKMGAKLESAGFPITIGQHIKIVT